MSLLKENNQNIDQLNKKGRDLYSHVIKPLLMAAAIILHLVLLFYLSFAVSEKESREVPGIFKMVDISEYIEENPEDTKKDPPKPVEKPKEDLLQVNVQDAVSEDVIVTDKEVVETSAALEPLIEYMPQHKISEPPGIPVEEIRGRIQYPPLANKQKIEGVVYLELFIDSSGVIRRIDILKDPGYGLAEAAIKALDGISCTPAMANGIPVAVRFRYPIRFQLK